MCCASMLVRYPEAYQRQQRKSQGFVEVHQMTERREVQGYRSGNPRTSSWIHKGTQKVGWNETRHQFSFHIPHSTRLPTETAGQHKASYFLHHLSFFISSLSNCKMRY